MTSLVYVKLIRRLHVNVTIKAPAVLVITHCVFLYVFVCNELCLNCETFVQYFHTKDVAVVYCILHFLDLEQFKIFGNIPQRNFIL